MWETIGPSPAGAPYQRMPEHLPVSRIGEGVLLGVPDQLFADFLGLAVKGAISQAFDVMRADEAGDYIYDTLTELFTSNGIPYLINESGDVVPSGGAAMSEAALQPAMDVLDDPRLQTAMSHLVEAQKRLQEHDPDEAVDEARMAVEYGMLALLDATSTPRPHRHQPNDLFNALEPTVLSRDGEELVLAAPRFRGRTSAGHAGSTPVTPGEAEAVVGAAAAALVFLVDKLP